MKASFHNARLFLRTISKAGWLLGFVLVLAVAAGCQTGSIEVPPGVEATSPRQPDPIAIREGDVITITFASTKSLDTVQQVRRDGKINLQMIGEVVAAGKTVKELEKELAERYKSQIVSTDITVSVQSSSIAIYVTGAVLRPGKITTDRPISAVQAVMEAGVDHSRANLKAVKIIRTLGGQTEHFKLNLRAVLTGDNSGPPPFMLKAGDIVYVPERFSVF